MRTKGFITFAFATSSFSTAFASSEKGRPRGVSPEFAKYYKDPSSFACIHNPSITLTPSQVNDDFCDCPDGSDEPGTSACSHIGPLSPPSVANLDPSLNHTTALPGFYCKNKGHNPGYIPFTYVNDGVCDYDRCCDGSDEWEGVGGVKCEDKCKEIGAAWKKQNAARHKARSAASQKRRELVIEAARLRKEIEDKISNARTLLAAAEIKVTDAQTVVAEAERTEKLRTIKAPKEGGKIGVLVSLGKKRSEDLKEGLLKVMAEKHDAEYRVRELEGILEAFKTEYNPNFNDEGVKRAVRAWEDYEARGRYPLNDHEAEKNLDDLIRDDKEHGIDWEDYHESKHDTDSLYTLQNYLPTSLRDWVNTKWTELRGILVENGILPGPESDGTESKELQDARTHLQSVESERDGHKNDIDNNENELTKTYGPDDVLRSLKGQCVTVESGEYTYEHCFLDKTVQKPNKGGMDTGMGYYDRIESVFVDEEEPADGKGLGSGERIAIKYENGAHCWNGPARSTTVILACAEHNEIWKVVEEEKCVYRMEAGSPAACTPDSPKAEPPIGKDEL